MSVYFNPKPPKKQPPKCKMTHSAKIFCSLIYADNGHVKFLICIENKKIKKVRTYSPSKLTCLGKYVFRNAKFVSHEQIKNFTLKKRYYKNIAMWVSPCKIDHFSKGKSASWSSI